MFDVTQISQTLLPLPPARRMEKLLDLLADAPPASFWPPFVAWFHRCENTWPLRGRILRRLRRAGCAQEWLSYGEKEAYDHLAPRQQVFRGCPSAFRQGFSWSLSRATASVFARQHSAAKRSSLVYEALIPKHAVFAVIRDDNDRLTVLLDPSKLHDVQRIDERRAHGGWALSFTPNAEFYDSNDDGKTAELKLEAPISWVIPYAPPPPIENMSDANLVAMRDQLRESLRLVRLVRKEASLSHDLRRAEKELAARAAGAKAGRAIQKPKPKGKSTGRPPKARPSNDNQGGAAEAA